MNLYDHLGHIVDLALLLIPFAVWLNRWAGKIERSTKFTKDVATIHLPHIYKRLRDHDLTLGLIPDEHPDIRWMNGSTPSEQSSPDKLGSL